LSKRVKPRRPYDSSGRQAHARQNRAAVLAAARRRFLADGYVATTVGAVAEEAGVSPETVYKAFGNKPGLLKAVVDVANVGDDEPVPMLERDVVRRIREEPDPRRKLRDFSEGYAERAQRSVPMQLVVRDAAATDPAAAAVWAQLAAERVTGMTAFAQHLDDEGHLRADVTVDEARDVLWAFTSPGLYQLLVVDRGWTLERFAEWMGDMLVAALLAPERPPVGSRRSGRAREAR
jgi:AcrR family transcriptional regulator